MTRLSFKLREGLAEDVARRVLGADFERASDVFYTALDKIKESAGLNFDSIASWNRPPMAQCMTSPKPLSLLAS